MLRLTELAGIKLYSIEDMCKFLNCSRFTVNKLCRERRIKATKIGREWKATQEALETYLNIQKIRR